MGELHEIPTRRVVDQGEVAIDPVCAMTVDPNAGKPTHEHEGRVDHFCSPRCRTKFAADPARYLEPSRREVEPAKADKGTLYTCPMHPEIVQEGPGSCPICGMALEPMGPPVREAGPNPELLDFTRRLKVGSALTVPSSWPWAPISGCRSTAGSARVRRSGSSSRWRRRSCCGPVRRSSSAAGSRSRTPARTCGR